MRPAKVDVERFLALVPDIERSQVEELTTFVRLCDVAWEVWPERQVFTSATRQIGFEIDLLARHFQPLHAPFPGCDECPAVFEGLRKIAEAVIPRGQRASWCEILEKSGLTYPPADRPPLASVTITILHRQGFEHAVDPCEIACLNEIEEKLAALGARSGKRVLGQVATENA